MPAQTPPSLTLAPLLALLLALLLATAGCEPWPAPTPVDQAVFEAEHEDWREWRRGRLVTPPGGAVLWIGLWDLGAGETAFGSTADLPIVLPAEDSPPLAGTFYRSDDGVEVRPAPGAPIRLADGTPVTEPLALANDLQESPTRLSLGSLGLRVHSERGTDRLWLRAWDEDHPEREGFRLPPYYPVDQDWRLAARFEEYEEPEILQLPDVTGGMVEYRAPGDLVFRKNGTEHRLIATATESSTAFFVMLWDSTATTETYQGGRYLRVPFPDESGWTEIDFNRTYNAPCVFTAYSVCALPPRPNWLSLAVTAGEKRPDKEVGLDGCAVRQRALAAEGAAETSECEG